MLREMEISIGLIYPFSVVHSITHCVATLAYSQTHQTDLPLVESVFVSELGIFVSFLKSSPFIVECSRVEALVTFSFMHSWYAISNFDDKIIPMQCGPDKTMKQMCTSMNFKRSFRSFQ